MTTAEIEYVPISAPTRKEERKSAAGRKTNEERARRAQEQEKASRRAKRIYADTPPVLRLLLGLVALLAAASFSVSFAGLYSAAAWAVGDIPALQVAVPVMLDIAIIAFTLALFVERERGDKVLGTWAAIAVFASVSAASNVLHTLAVSTATTPAQLVVGAIISGGAPILLAFASDKIAVKTFTEVER